jgi:hypothetical protein
LRLARTSSSEEHLRVDEVEAARQRRAAGGEVERRADRRRRVDDARLGAALAEPLGEHVAAERNAGREQARGGKALARPAQDPVALGRVSRVVGAQQPVRFARAAAEVRHQAAPAAVGGGAHDRPRVVRLRVSFEPVKEHQHRRARAGGLRQREVDVDEVAVRRVPPLAPVLDPRLRHQPRRADRLQVRARQPQRSAVARLDVRHQRCAIAPAIAYTRGA